MAGEEDLKKLEEIANPQDEKVELPPEIMELIESGQLPEEIVEGLQSGEITVDELLDYLGDPVPDELEEEIDQQVRKIGIFESSENDFKALLVYSLAFFAQQSAHMAEESLKQEEESQANHFMKKTRIIRKIIERTFGGIPEKDYYLGGFKEIRKLKGKIPHEEMMEMAEFSAQNVVLEEALQANPKLLRKAFKEQLPSIKGFGLATKYRAFLKEKYIKYAKQDRPDKEGVIFELLILFKVVESVYLSVKDQKKK